MAGAMRATLDAFLRGRAAPAPNGWKPPAPVNLDGGDPARMTLAAWLDRVNPGGRMHAPSAYDPDVESLAWVTPARYPELLRRVRVAGLAVELRYKAEPIRWRRRDAAGEYTDETMDAAEMRAAGLPLPMDGAR